MQTKSNVWILVLAAVMFAGMNACTKAKPKSEPEVKVDMPTGLVATVNKTTGNIRFDWARNSFATNYEVEVVGTEVYESTKKSNTYTVLISELEYNTSYTWRVRTFVGDAVSGWAESTFKTGSEPNTGLYLGIWEASPDDVNVEVEAFGFKPSLSDLELDGYEQPTENLELKISAVPGVDNKVLLTIKNLETYMPTAEIEDVELTVKPDNTLYGSQGETEEIPFELSEPVPVSEIPGLTDLLGGITIDANIKAISIKINSITVTGNMANAENTEAQFVVVTSAFMGIKTDNSTLDTIIEAALTNQSISMKSTISCKKKDE